tara:strand:+ start:2073 stop:2498 length:426 start_codon:yes stop_codon:yes gene_type:complete
MDSISLFFDEDPKTFFAYALVIISTFSIILIGLSFYYDYLKKKELLKQFEVFDRSLKDLVEEFRSFELIFSDQKKSFEEYRFIINRVEQEISRLADSLSNEKNITSAISLAKEGYSVLEISEKTGIPQEEIEPIVKYHGSN